MIKVVAFNGSPREKGNTNDFINIFLDELRTYKIDSVLHQIGEEHFRVCQGYFTCMKTKHCVFENEDNIQKYFSEMIEADAIVLGSPTRMGNIAGNLKVFLERITVLAKASTFPFLGKVGIAIVNNRKAGGLQAYNMLNTIFSNKGMILPGSSYWPIGFGLMPEDSQKWSQNAETVLALKNLARNTAWILQKIHGIKTTSLPDFELPDRYRNFAKTITT